MRQPRGPQPVSIELTKRLHTILEEMVRSRRRPHDEVQRASIILQSAAGPVTGILPRSWASVT
jgi:hypothetical protein